MQIDRIAGEYVLELQLTPSGQASTNQQISSRTSLRFVLASRLSFGPIFQSARLHVRLHGRSSRCWKCRCLGTPDDPSPSRTNHRVVIAKYYITLASTRRRTLQYYRSARLALAKWAYLRSLQCGQKPNDRTPLAQVRQLHFPAEVLRRLTSLRHPLRPCCVLVEETRSGCVLRVVA